MLTGQNGILNRASEAKDKTGISQEEESVKLSISDALTQGLGSITTENLQTALTNNGLKGPITGDGPWVYTGDYKKYDIGTSGSMTSSDKNNSSSEKIVKLMGNYGVSEDGRFFKMDVDMENLSDKTWTEVNKKSELSEIGKIKKSVAYEGVFFVITENGDLYGWGSNWSGQLGIGNTENQASPVKVTGVSNVEDIYCGTSSTFVKTKTGEVYAFGYNRYGRLGIGNITDQNTPVKISTLSNIKAIYIGSDNYNSFAVTETGDVYSWGENREGRLGIGNTTNQSAPVKINALSNIKEIYTNGCSSWALTKTGDVYSWGDNGYGQLGIGNTTDQNTPVKISTLSNIKAIYIGSDSYNSFAVTETGDVYAWGSNEYGQLGIGIKGDQQTPVKLNSLTNIEKIYTTGYSSFAKTISGDIYAWGSNSGDLGTGNTDYQLSPVKISQVSNVDEMIVDNEYGTAYARTTNSKIYCMSEENYLPGIFDVSKQGLNLEENDEICNIDIVKYKGDLLDQVKVINTIQGHMYVYYMISMPA